MKVLIALCMCLGLSVAQQLPNYFQGSFNIPNAPIPAPGAGYGGAPAPAAPAAYRPQAAAYSAAPRQQWSPAASPAQYAPSAPAYSGYGQPAPAAAPVSSVPSSYGWNVQHSSPAPPQPQPQAVIPTAQPAAAPQYRQYAAPQPQQYAPQQWSAPAQAQPQQYAQPQPAAAAPTSPISAALLRPASVHYANIGESLSGDYKFGYKTGNGDSFREESRAPDGTVQGQYGFVDADGKERVVKYSAGVNGFQILNGEGGAPAPAAPARAPAQQWGQPAAPQQSWGAPAAAPQQSWAAPPAAPQQQWGAAPAAPQQQWG